VTEDRKPNEPPLKLDMSFGEALERFARVKPKEVAESVERSKAKKPPEGTPGRPAPPSRRRKPGDDVS
jgi:hypothetical protein